MGELIVWFIFMYVFSLAFGMILSKLTWTPPGQGWRRNEG